MKKLLFIASLLISLNSFSQFSVGPAAYIGKSELSNDIESVRTESNYTEFGNSYAAGLFGEYQIKKWFSIQLDVLYDQLNSEQFYFVDKSEPNRYRSNQLDRLEYLTLPLTLQFNYKRLKLNMGCQASFLMSAYSDRTVIDQFGKVSNWAGDSDGRYLESNYSFITGLSFNVYKNIHIEGRYTRGLPNIMDERTGYKYSATTSQFLIGLYYQILLKKKESKNR